MNWVSPFMGWWALAALPVIALYILKIRRRRQPVSTSMFWAQVYEEASPRAWWQRLRNLASLLVQLLFLFLVVFALMDPLTAGQKKDRRLVVLAVDTSASMRASDGTGNDRLTLAQEKAADVLNGLRAWDQALVVGADQQVRVLCGRTGNRKVLEEAIDRLETHPVASGSTALIDLVSGLALEDRKLDVQVFTDAQGLAERGEWPTNLTENVSWHVVGEPAENLALTAFDLRPFEANPFFVQFLVAVRNGSDTAQKAKVQLRRNEVLFDTVVIDVAPFSTRSMILDEEVTEPGVYTAQLAEGGALADDDELSLVVRPPRAFQVALVGPRNVFLEGLLSIHPLIAFDRFEGEVVNDIDWTGYDLAVFDQAVPREPPSCDQLYLGPNTDSTWWTLEDPGGVVLVETTTPDDPVLRHVDLSRVFVRKSKRFKNAAPRGWREEVLAESNGDPVLTAWKKGKQQVLALGFGLDESDLALRTAFPILFSNALNHFSERDVAERGAWRTGDSLPLTDYDPPIQVVETPAGERTDVAGLPAYGPLDAIGVYRLFPDPEAEAFWPIAVNMVHPSEADTGRALPDEMDEGVQLAGSGASGHPVWWWLILIAVVLSAVEWMLYNRRRLE